MADTASPTAPGRAPVLVARAALLAGPTALAFASGGYFSGPREVAAVAAWLLAALVALTGRRPPLPGSRAGWLALAGLVLLTGWVALSTGWAPLVGPAHDDVERLLLYLGFFVAGLTLWDSRSAARLLEPALAASALVVVGYGVAGRLLPGIVHFHSSLSAAGRLDQPLTYWNAMGEMAAFGLVLCARMMGDGTRRRSLRAAAAAAAPVFGLALYLTFSRGAIAALLAGLCVLAVVDRSADQQRAALTALGGGVLAALVSSFLPAVELKGGHAQLQGVLMLLALIVIGGPSALLQWRSRAPGLPSWLPRRAAAAIAVVLVVAAVAVSVGVADHGPNVDTRGATARRLAQVGSNRYGYWRVAFEDFRSEPLRGVGTSGFAVDWLRHRKVKEAARDAHSLYIETAAELGLAGLAALALFVGGLVAAVRRGYREDPALVTGWCAALTVFALHAGLDWDWEMPAVTLPALLLAAAIAGRRSGAPVSSAR